MLRNHVKIAFRNLARHKGYTLINVTGLAVGMAACILILLYVQNELSYDRYHDQADRLYRVTLRGKLAGRNIHTANTCPPMAAGLLQEFPEVAAVTRLDDLTESTLVTKADGTSFNEERLIREVERQRVRVRRLPILPEDPT